MSEEQTKAEAKLAAELAARKAKVEAKLARASTALQKADCQRQLMIINAGDDDKAVAKVNADYVVYKNSVFAAAKKAKAEARAKAVAGSK